MDLRLPRTIFSVSSLPAMGRKQKRKNFSSEDYDQNTTHLEFGDDDEVIELRKPEPKPEPIARPSFSPKPSYKDRNGSQSHHSESSLPGPPAKKKFKLDPKPELTAFRKDLPIYSGTLSIDLLTLLSL